MEENGLKRFTCFLWNPEFTNLETINQIISIYSLVFLCLLKITGPV